MSVVTGTSSNGTATAAVAGTYTVTITDTSTDLAAPNTAGTRAHATSVDDGQTRTIDTLHPTGRVLEHQTINSITGDTTSDTLNGYNGPRDNPAYTLLKAGGPVTTNLNPGTLTAQDTGGTITYMAANLHGDIAGTLDQTGTFTANPDTDEYGAGPLTANGLNWLGTRQRYTTGNDTDTIRMGQRLYQPTLGRFLQADPVEGGSANNYDYVAADPVNGVDLNGQWCWAQVGTTCTRYVKDMYGRSIPVQHRFRKKVLDKHGIRWETLKYLIRGLPQIGGQGTQAIFMGDVTEVHCAGILWFRSCAPTGRVVTVRIVVDFSDYKGGTFGLVTAYCMGWDGLCPGWINNAELR